MSGQERKNLKPDSVPSFSESSPAIASSPEPTNDKPRPTTVILRSTTGPSVSSTVAPRKRPQERRRTTTAPIATTKPTKNLSAGHAFIINSVNFKDKEKRYGSDKDAERMCNVLESFKLTVNIHKDPTVHKVNDIVKKIILSHGGKSEMIEAADGQYNMDATILHPILTIPSLKNKPKLFFIQACKGELVPGAFMKDATRFGEPSEILKCYGTFEGYQAYRTRRGSLFVGALCKELKLNGRHTDIETIMKNVTAEVRSCSKYVSGNKLATSSHNSLDTNEAIYIR